MPEANTRFLERVAISILRKFKTIIWLSIPPTRVLDPLIAFMSGRRRKDCYLTMLLLFRPRFRRLWKEIIAMSWEILTVTATIHSPTVLTWTKWTIKWSPTRALKLSKSQHCGPVNSWGATTTDRCPLYQVMKINFLEISNFNWAFGCVGREIHKFRNAQLYSDNLLWSSVIFWTKPTLVIVSLITQTKPKDHVICERRLT